MLNDPTRDFTTIEIDLRLSILKPDHAKVIKNVYAFIKTEKGRNIILAGLRVAVIRDVNLKGM